MIRAGVTALVGDLVGGTLAGEGGACVFSLKNVCFCLFTLFYLRFSLLTQRDNVSSSDDLH